MKPQGMSVVYSLEDPSTGVRHVCRDLSHEGSCVVTCKEGYAAGGSLSTTFSLCLSSGEFVSNAQTVRHSDTERSELYFGLMGAINREWVTCGT